MNLDALMKKRVNSVFLLNIFYFIFNILIKIHFLNPAQCIDN